MSKMSVRLTLFSCVMFLYSVETRAQIAEVALKKYYSLVQHASVDLAKGEAKSAVLFYDQAFAEIPNPFFVDVNNAIYAESLQKNPDTLKIAGYLKRLQRKGFCVHEHYRHSSAYNSYLSKVSEDSCKMILSPSGRELIDQCIKRDQVLRVFCSEVLLTPYDTTVRPAIDNLDSVNYAIVTGFLKQVSYKGEGLEELIGYEAVEDLNLVLQHNATWGRVDFPGVINCVRNGLLEARREASLMDAWCSATYFRPGSPTWKSTNNCDKAFGLYGTLASAILGKTVLISKIKDEGLAMTIKTRRDLLFLGDVYDDAKLTAFAYYQRSFRYPGIIILGDDGMGKMIEEKLKEKKFVFIGYHGKEDFDYNRGW